MWFLWSGAFLMLLTACKPTVFTRWGHPTKTEGQFSQDSQLCEALAAKHTTANTTGYKDPSFVIAMDGSASEAMISEYLRCIGTHGWKISDQIVADYKGEEQLDDDLKRCRVLPDSNRCMIGKGWLVVDHPPWLKINRILDRHEYTTPP